MEKEKATNNMEFWDKIAYPEVTAVKPIKGGKFASLNFSNVNTQARLKMLTELFGPYGKGWYIDNVIPSIDNSGYSPESKASVRLELHVKYPDETEWSEPIIGFGGAPRVSLKNDGTKNYNRECYKCAYSDAVSVAGRFLGLAASVYLNQYAKAPLDKKTCNEKSPNLKYYKMLDTPEHDFVNAICGGKLKGLSSINSQWRLMRLTKVFGPYGKGWKIQNVQTWTEDDDITNTSLAYVSLELCVKYPGDTEWSKPAYGIGSGDRISIFRSGTDFSDEAFKCAYTDAISFAGRQFGLAGKVYENTWDSKYSDDRPEGNEGEGALNPVDVTQYMAPKTGINDVPVQTAEGKITQAQYDILDKEFNAFTEKGLQWFFSTYKIDDIWQLPSVYAQSVIDYKRKMNAAKAG